MNKYVTFASSKHEHNIGTTYFLKLCDLFSEAIILRGSSCFESARDVLRIT